MEIGDKVFLKPINDNARWIKDDIMNHIEEWEISKIGRKYLTVIRNSNRNSYIKFYIDTLQHFVNIGSCCYNLYFSIQEIHDEAEAEIITRKLRNVFGGYGKTKLTLEQLRSIDTIIKGI